MLILDIECQTFGKPNPKQDKLKFIGMYEYETKKYHFFKYNQIQPILTVLKKHRVIITHNGENYDIPILDRQNLWQSGHTSLDTYQILKKRKDLLGWTVKSLALDKIAQYLKLDNKKYEIDYKIFNKDEWTQDELEKIKEYTLQDVKVTKEIFDKLYDFFIPWSRFLNQYDVDNFKWLTSSVGVYSYKVICNLADLEEVYEDAERKDYPGGYVADPSGDEFKEDIYLLDYSSLYPWIYIMLNLFSYNCRCCKEDEKVNRFGEYKAKGKYCAKKQGKIEKAIKEIYKLRREYKKAGKYEQYALKIVMNTMYGICGNPVFKSVYNYNSVYDCTQFGQYLIKKARDKFKKAGYGLIYGDTDSIFIKDNYKDEDRLIMVQQSLMNDIKDEVSFFDDLFEFKIEDKIKYLWFFKSGEKYNKKQYIYVNYAGKLKIKGLPMIKSDSSKIGLMIFNKYMKDKVKNGLIHFDYNEIRKHVIEEIENDISIVMREFKVFDFEEYKNPNQLQAQIALKFGPGIHKLIPNRYVGIGKSVRYATLDEFKEANLTPFAIILNKLWSELSIFLNYTPKDVKTNKKRTPQTELLRWTNID